MKGVEFLVALVLFALASKLASASDPSPLQDFCVAVNDTKDGGVFFNALFSLNLHLRSIFVSTDRVEVSKLAKADHSWHFSCSNYAPYGGLNPPHTHPRATEILVVVEGTLYVGFVTSNPENHLFTKVLYPGDVFVFPVGLIHFQFNIGHTNAVAFAGLSSQNPGVITIANAVFGSDPAINPDVLAKAFQLDKNIVKQLQSRFWWDNN
ncbi:Germin-like protein subfamily 1 member 7 [Hibiscus syriacus]|uniref:Germin-like protein n=1 Tax=Hibiscus syriacus TaxID=106335 RepID=A0A6A2XUQ2_HIBSY|nr:Germin-like protein subfamily 1 member 7 [Hibiscus syriacus]